MVFLASKFGVYRTLGRAVVAFMGRRQHDLLVCLDLEDGVYVGFLRDKRDERFVKYRVLVLYAKARI